MINLKDYSLCNNIKETGLDIIHQWYWEVTLSDGQKVYQDDGLPGLAIPSAWIRLGNFIRDRADIAIARFGVYFRTNSYFLPDAKHAYYFSKGTLQGVGASSALHYYVMGYLEQPDTIHTLWIKVPELVPINQYTKPLVKCPSPMLISAPVGLTFSIPQL